LKAITYILRDDKNNSDVFYSGLSKYTGEVIEEAERSCFNHITAYRDFLEKNKAENLRTNEEYLFEFLAIGVLWTKYSYSAGGLSYPVFRLLSFLYNLRQRKRSIKKYVDYVRGLLATIFLYKPSDNNKPAASPFVTNFKKLMNWLYATGEFKEEVKRLELWNSYFDAAGEQKAMLLLIDAIKFARWFEYTSEEALGQYTRYVDVYLNTGLKKHKWKEDIIFCARSRVEYHLNMVGSEIMNAAFEKNFSDTKEKAVLIPACMKLLPDKERNLQGEYCKAERRGLDYICTNCSPACRVHQLNKMGEKEKFKVYIIPHSSDFSLWLREHGVNSNIGTVGVACINNLISGGLELKSLDIPAQCVFLDHCGCKNHWHKTGFPTDINFKRLGSVLKSKEETGSFV
jgi:hypothetical protein